MRRFLPGILPTLISYSLFFAICPAAAQPQSTPASIFTHTVVQPYGGDVNDEAAYEAAVVLARHALVDMLSGWLANHSALSLAFAETPPRAVADALIDAKVTGTEFLTDASSEAVAVTVTASFFPSQTVQKAKELLLHNDLLSLHRYALQHEQNLLDHFVSLTGQRKTPYEETPKGSAEYSRLVNALRSMQAYREVLPLLQTNGIWQVPETVTERMRAAIDLDQRNPLAWNALGEAHYQLERTIDAAGEQDTAIRLNPEFARAWHARGTAYLKLSLAELALEDFTRALVLEPEEASYWQARGSAYLVLNKFDAMCRDYAKACSLGNCDSLHWARSRGHCPDQ